MTRPNTQPTVGQSVAEPAGGTKASHNHTSTRPATLTENVPCEGGQGTRLLPEGTSNFDPLVSTGNRDMTPRKTFLDYDQPKVNPSSWIDKVLYRNHYIAIFLKPSHTRPNRPNRPPTALLYSNVPSWMCGLIQAGEGGQSIGSAYNSLLKRADAQAKYGIQYQRVEGEERVRELERMMTGAL